MTMNLAYDLAGAKICVDVLGDEIDLGANR